MKARTRFSVAAVTALALFASACGDDESTSSDSVAADAIPAVAKNDAAIALLPEAFASKTTLVVALDATYPPSEFVAEDGTTIVGFDVDLMVAIGQALGMEVDLQNASFDAIIPGISSGKYDVGASSFTDTKEREQAVDFVTYFTAGTNFYVAANGGVEVDGLDSLCGHSVAVQKATIQEEYSSTQDAKCKEAGKEGVEVLSFDTQTDANLAVASGRAEVGFADSPVAAYIATSSNGQLKVSGTPFDTAPYGLALAKNGLAPAVLEALKGLIADGTYGKILAKWGVSDGAITEPVINGAIF